MMAIAETGGSQDPLRFQARVVSLASSIDRRRQMTVNLGDFPHQWAFHDAHSDAALSGLTCRADRQIDRFGRPLSVGEAGCFSSHLDVLDIFESDPGLQWLLVLEDDVWLDTSFPFLTFIDIFEKSDIHYVKLFARRYKMADVLAKVGSRQIIRFRTDPYGNQAYLVDRTGAQRLVRSIKSIDRPIDDAFARFWVHGLDLVAVYPFPAIERGESGLQTERAHIQVQGPRGGVARMRHRLADYIAKRWHNLRVRTIGQRHKLVVTRVDVSPKAVEGDNRPPRGKAR